MVINKKSICRFLVIATLLGCFLALIGHPLRINILPSIATWIIAGSVLLSTCLIFTASSHKKFLIPFLLVIILSAFSLLSSFQSGYSVLVKYITFLELPMLLYLLHECDFELKSAKWICSVFGIYVILCIYFQKSPVAYDISISNEFNTNLTLKLKELTMGYNNPNEAALYLLIAFIVVFAGFYMYKNLIVRTLFLVGTIYTAYLILLTYSRSAIILMFFISIAALLTKCTISKPVFFYLVCSVPIFVMIFTLFFPNVAEAIVVLDEQFDTGRGILYREVLNNLNLFTFFFGNFNRYQLSNLHNAYISIVASLGFPTFLAFQDLIRKSYITTFTKKTDNKAAIVVFWGLIAVILYSSFEAFVLVSGTFGAASMFLLFVMYKGLSNGGKTCE